MTSSFTHYWEQRKFSDVVEIGSGMDYKHLGEGDIPVYGTGGYMLSVDAALSEDKDAIGIGRKGTIDKPYILRAPFWTVDTLFYCIPKDGYDLDFTSGLFQNVDWKKKDESTGVPSLSKVIINNVETAAPSYEEQRKIGDYFKEIDNLITLHQRKPLTNSYYINPWEQRKLSDLIIEYKETVDSDCTLPVLTSSKAEGIVLQEEHFGRVQNHDITGYNILPRNYCTYRNRSDGVDFTFNINRCCDKGIISKFYPVFYGNNSDIFFISMVLNYCDEVVHEIAYTCTGTGQKVLSFLDLQKMNIRVPSYDEQKKISRFFEQLDNLITLHRRMFISQKRRAYKCIKRQ
ncbi:MAG: restriction endonuclease subunit S [Lachnospiraceae bacterium]|nr:restriction endonuclease subunit S [Lachnospiraceae bacterium]